MTIGQFAHASGLTPKALRFYDEKGLLVPEEIDRHTGYRRYGPAQLRRAATIRVMRHMDMSLPDIHEALDNPDRCDELVAGHRRRIVAGHAARMAALDHGAVVLAAYDEPVDVRVRTAGVQPWAGVVMEVDPRTVDDETDPGRYDAAFGRLATSLQEAGNPPVGTFWTTVGPDRDGRGVRLLLCWPVATPPAADFAVDGLCVEHGVLPERREAFVRIPFDEPDLSALPVPHPRFVALLEHLDRTGGSEPDTVRQVGVTGEDGLPAAVELTVTIG